LNIIIKSCHFGQREWELIYKEEFDNKTEALKREKWLKTGVGREYLKKILEK